MERKRNKKRVFASEVRQFCNKNFSTIFIIHTINLNCVRLKVRLFNKNGFKDKALSTQKFCASRSRRGYVRFDSVNENQETLQVR